MTIPIANIYYLLSYAWDKVDQLPWENIATTEINHPVDLLASLLIQSTEKLIKKGLDRGYLGYEEDIRGVRGKIKIATTIKTLGHKQGRLTCEFDEYSFSIIHNQIIKATLKALSKTEKLPKDLREHAYELYRQLSDISEIRLSLSLFSKVQLHSNIRHYRMPISICKMIFEELLPDPQKGNYSFAAFSEDKLFNVFEKFLQNFYKFHIADTSYKKAHRERFNWQKSEFLSGDKNRLPKMNTDLSLTNNTTRLVIESKFYRKALVGRYSGENEGALISTHLYQLFAYVRNLAEKDGRLTKGILVYPATTLFISSDYEIHGHPISVRTIDLMQSPDNIKQQLINAV